MPMRTVLGFVAYVADTGEGKPAILKGAQGKVYSVNDVGLTTPLACRDMATEEVIPNPTSNEDGYIGGFKVSISETADGILWVAGAYAIYQPFLGVKGPKGDQGGLDAAAAATVVAAQNVVNRANAGEFTGADGQDGSNVIPTGDAIKAAISPGGAAEGVLKSTFISTLGPSNGANDAPVIQAALDAARDAGGGVVRGLPGVWYLIRSRLVIGSETEIDANVELAPGISTNILNNRAHVTAQRTVNDSTIAKNSKTLTSATAAFTSADVGRSVSVAEAGADGGVGNDGGVVPVGPINLSARIVKVVNATTVELDYEALTAASGTTAGIYDRDTNIVVRGRWRTHNGGGPGTDVHHLLMQRVDGITIDVDEFTADTTGSKYAIYLGDYTRLDLDVRGMDVTSDGVHLQGPAMGPNLVRNIEGISHDDFLAVGTGDNTGGGRQKFCGGSMELEVQTLRPAYVGTNCALKLYGMDGHTLSANVGSIIGATAGVNLGAADVQGVYLEEVTIGLVDNAQTEGVRVFANAGSINIGKLTNRLNKPGSVAYGLNVNKGLTVDSFVIGQLAMPNAASNAPGSAVVKVSSSIKDFSGGQFQGTLPPSGAYLTIDAEGAIERATITNVSQSGGGALVKAPFVGAELGTLYLTETTQHGSSFLVDLNTKTVLHLSNVEHIDHTSGSINIRSAADVIVLGSGATRINGNTQVASGGKLRINCPEFRTDVAKVTNPGAGDRLFNQNVSIPPYVAGEVIRESSGHWSPIAGYTKKGTTALAAGTVTVADNKITGGSEILVSILQPAGTVGTPYVYSRNAGSGFTIKSTSDTDKSVIMYTVLKY